MNKKDHALPATEYKNRKDLIQALDHLLNDQMPIFRKEYRQQEKLEKKIEKISSFQISIFFPFILAAFIWFLLSSRSSPFRVNLFHGSTIRQELEYSAIFILLVGLVFVVLMLIARNAIRNHLEKQKSYTEEILSMAYDDYAPCPVGYRYARPKTVTAIKDLISDGRADSVKEAINLMITDENYSRLLKYQASIARSGKQTALFTGLGAFFNWRTSHWAKKSAGKNHGSKKTGGQY